MIQFNNGKISDLRNLKLRNIKDSAHSVIKIN